MTGFRSERISHMTSYALLGLCALILLINIIVGLKRGLFRSGLRLLTVIPAAIAAFILANKLAKPLAAKLLPLIDRFAAGRAFADFFAEHPETKEAVVLLCKMLAAPLAFFLLYWLFKLVTLIVYKILVGCFSVEGPKNGLLRIPGGLLTGILIGLISATVWIVPVIGYCDTVDVAVTAMTEKSESDTADIEAKQKDYIQPVVKTPGASTLYDLMGQKLFDSLTSATWNNQKTTLRAEMQSLGALAGDATSLTGKKPAEWDATQSAAVQDMASSIGTSPMLSSISSTLLHVTAVTWQENSAVFTIAKPEVDGSAELILNGFLEVFSTSDPNNVGGDLTSFANVFALMVRYDIFEQMTDEEDNTLVENMAATGFLAEVQVELKKNPRMKPVNDAIVAAGMRAVIAQLGVPENYRETCGELMDDITDTLKTIDRNPDGTLNKDALANTLDTVLENNGVDVSDATVDLVAESLSDRFTPEELEKMANGTMTDDEIIDALIGVFSDFDGAAEAAAKAGLTSTEEP